VRSSASRGPILWVENANFVSGSAEIAKITASAGKCRSEDELLQSMKVQASK
jgi:hypothetical protein